MREYNSKIHNKNLEVVMMDNGDWEYDRVGIGVEDGKCVVVDIEEGCDEDGNYLGWKVKIDDGYSEKDKYRFSMGEDDLNKFENWLKVNKG